MAIQINSNNPFAAQDYSTIINTFEKNSTGIDNEEYALASHYKDVYSTRNFSERAQEQMAYYPGMHQTSPSPEVDPFYTNAKQDSNQDLKYWNDAFDSPEAFQDAIRDKSKDFDYQDIFGSDLSAEERARAIGKMFTECVPCFGRVTSLEQLLPNGNLLEVHLLNIKARVDLLDQIKNLFTDPGGYVDICQLINLLSGLCPSDLVAMTAMLTQYLAKINLDIKFNIDFIINLVGPILSPFLNALSQWLDKWMQLIFEPMLCVLDHINSTIITAQQVQIPFSSAGLNVDFDLGNYNGLGTSLFANQKAQGGGLSYNLEDDVNAAAYKEQKPESPTDEIEASYGEMKQAWKPTESEAERRNKFDKLINENKEQQTASLQGRKIIQPRDNGTLWTNGDTPASEKYENKKGFGDNYYPPEKQGTVSQADSYFDPAPIADSLLQMRNILQASIQYSSDWFTYITQMIYDLLGTDIAWMQKKTGSSFIKSRILQLILILKSIIEAVSKNGLECGLNSNFDEPQLKFILENTLNKFTTTKFVVNDNGTIEIIPPTVSNIPDVQDLSDEIKRTQDSDTTNSTIDAGNGIGEVAVPQKEIVEQKAQESGIIVKNCLRGLSGDQLSEVQSWINEYERSLNG